VTQSTNSNNSQATLDWKVFSRKTWVVVMSGLFLPPLGIVLAWLKPDWSRRAKWIATGLMGLMLLSMMSNREKDGATGPQEASSPTEAAIEQPNESSRNQNTQGYSSGGSKLTTIAADDLVKMNPAAVSKKLKGRFVVTGRVMETKVSKGSWGRKIYTFNISGDARGDQRLNSRGYVSKWVQCEFDDDAGLENIQGGQFVHIEGVYEDNLGGDVVRMTKCKLSRDYHTVN
jgi:hypothetical protein